MKADDGAELVTRCRRSGDAEVVSWHKTFDSARVRVSQMRKSTRWSSLPLTLTAAKTSRIFDGVEYEAAVFARYSAVPGDGELLEGRMEVDVDLSAMPEEQYWAFLNGVSAVLEAQDAGESGGVVTVPAEFVRFRHVLDSESDDNNGGLDG